MRFVLEHLLLIALVAWLALAVVVAWVVSGWFAVDGERRCINCGCTDLNACPGGCAWASYNPPVCTRCA